jgi:hypothetical protein
MNHARSRAFLEQENGLLFSCFGRTLPLSEVPACVSLSGSFRKTDEVLHEQISVCYSGGRLPWANFPAAGWASRHCDKIKKKVRGRLSIFLPAR